ncbi:MAG: hypothetical protein KF805_14700 [Phycisphaeraceae bacterium]|nr:hypothetical protein [Phycisphaeraceae bacterium]
MNKQNWNCRLLLVVAAASGFVPEHAGAHVDLANATVTATTGATSNLMTSGGSNTLNQPGGTGAFPNWQGYSDASQSIGLSSILSTSDLSLFMNSTLIYTNGFANAWVKPGTDMVAADASASARIEIDFHVHGDHYFEIHSVDVNQLDGEGSAVMLKNGVEVFRYQGVHVHEIRGELADGDYQIVLTAATQSGISGPNSVGIFEFEFEVFEGSLCLADLNGDRLVDDADFVEFAAAYNTLVCPALRGARHEEGCPADFNSDQIVDDTDFVIFAAAYNELICP